MLKQYELQITKPDSDKKTWVVWEGENGIDACWRYAHAHIGAKVYAWRDYPQHGVFLVHPSQIVG